MRQLVRQACAEAILRGRTHQDAEDELVDDEESDDECGGEAEETTLDPAHSTFLVRADTASLAFTLTEVDELMDDADCESMLSLLSVIASSFEPLDVRTE